MTIKELIEELKKFDENLIVVVGPNDGESYTPCLNIIKRSFKSSYWDGNSIIKIIPENTEYLEL